MFDMLSGICQGMSWQHLHQPQGWKGVIPLSLSLSPCFLDLVLVHVSLQQFAWPEALQFFLFALQWTIVTRFSTNVNIPPSHQPGWLE